MDFPVTPVRYRLRKEQRLRTPAQFQRVYSGDQALHGPVLVLFFLGNGLEFSRLGVSVSKKHGNAVRRNRIKRVLREAYRLLQYELPEGYDYVLIPRRGVDKYTLSVVKNALQSILGRIPPPPTAIRVGHARAGESDDRKSDSVRRRGVSKRTYIKKNRS